MDEQRLIPPPAIGRDAPAGFWTETWRHFRRRKMAMAALLFVAALGVVALSAPMIVGTKPIICQYKGEIYFPFLGYYNRSWENAIFRRDRFRNVYPESLRNKDPQHWAIWPLIYQDPYRRVRGHEWPKQPGNPVGVSGAPNRYNLFGTNQQGFDVFAQMVHGTQIALSVGFVSMGIAATIGITMGALAGYFGGWVDMLLSRLIELVMCVPSLVLILALVALLEEVSNLSSHGDYRRHKLDRHRPAYARRVHEAQTDGVRDGRASLRRRHGPHHVAPYSSQCSCADIGADHVRRRRGYSD